MSAASLLVAGLSHAQDAVAVEAPEAPLVKAEFSSALVLNDRQISYDVAPFLYKTRDPQSDLGTREIFIKHRNNLKGERLTPGPINLSFDPVPYWMIVDITNNSRKTDWVLDFGSIEAGRFGIIPRMFVNDGQRDILLVDALPRAGVADLGSTLNGHTLPLSILPGQQLSLILYIVPSDHSPLVLTPRIVETSTYMHEIKPGEHILQLGVLGLLMGGFVFFCGNMLSRRGIGFFPHALFFASQAAWFWLSSTEIFTNMPASLHLPGIALATGALLALAVTQSLVASQDSETGDSILLYICASFILLAIMVFIFAVPTGSILRPGIVYGAAALGYLIAAVKAFTVRAELRWAGVIMGVAWLTMILSGAMPPLAALGYIPLDQMFLQLPWTLMPLICVLLIISGVMQIRANNLGIIRDVLRQAQRAQALSRMKQTKETADQARLLRVIEREREIMEDLRNRDAERTEEMRMAKIGADEANRAKSAFLAVVSHEIRTPMTGIMGMLRLMADTQMNGQQREYAQTIQDSGDAMLALLNDILDFSKIESGGLDLEIIDFDLHRVVSGVAMLMNGHAAGRGIYLNTDIAPNTQRYLKGDPTRLRQVLLNLVGNAIKFTSRGGVTIHIHTGDPSVVPDDKADQMPIYFGVEDTGIGISEEAQKNLFNPFSQADSSIARKFGGTGLGLAICKRLIETMGSAIQLESREGQGSTFFFTLVMPCGDAGAIEEAENSSGPLSRPMHVLVVDDNAINRKVIEGLLIRDQHDVVCAESGEDALAQLQQNFFDIVLMDIEMPGMDGLSVLSAIRNGADHIREIPVIALTGNIGSDDTARYRAAGMNDVLAKPIDPERMRAVMLAFGGARPDNYVAPTQPGYEISPEELDEDSFAHSIAEETPQQVTTQVAPDGLFDQSILQTLRASLGQTQLNEMMVGVFEHNRKVLPNLQAALNEGDVDNLRAYAHELKGMNGNFGLKAISDICAQIEQGARHNTLSADKLDELVFNDLGEAMTQTEYALMGR